MHFSPSTVSSTSFVEMFLLTIFRMENNELFFIFFISVFKLSNSKLPYQLLSYALFPMEIIIHDLIIH